MGKASQFTKLLEPVRIGEMEIRNRIVMSGMGVLLANEDGYVTEQVKAWYRERSNGGVGLIIVETTAVDLGGRTWPRELCIHDDKVIPGLRELTHIIKEHGARAAIQINHTGPHANSETTGMQPISASTIGDPGLEIPREMSIDEIKEMVQIFARGAERAQKAGFDGIEIHAAHRYLINSFLSTSLNQRKDEYGGDLNNRARFLLEVIHAIKQAVGSDYPVWCRFNGEEYGVEGGITIEETEEFARLTERAGAQAVHISAFGIGEHYTYLAPVPFVGGSFVQQASRIKKVVKVPVITVGRINPSLAETILKEGKADLVAMGRALIADPNLPNKIAAGKSQEVQPCIACLRCLDHVLPFPNRPIHVKCSVNPAAGKELESELSPATKPKDVLVVGGGPAGMEAAIVAATRGHKVTLCDSRPRLGGALVMGAIVNEELEDLVKYLVTQIKSLPVEIKLSTEVTPALIAEIKPQAVIVATGGIPITLELPGVEGKNVISIKDIYGIIGDPLGKRNGSRGKLLLSLASGFTRYFYNPSIIRWFIKRGFLFGKSAIVISGGLAGVELGTFLTDMGRRVTVVEESEIPGAGLSPVVLLCYLDKIINGGGAILTGVKLERITEKGLVITGRNGISEELVGDTVILALGARADSRLSESLQGKAHDVYSVGDCVDAQTVLEAITGGFNAARAI